MAETILSIGSATDRMLSKMRERFEVVQLTDIRDFDLWAKENGDDVVAVSTFGQDGIAAEKLALLPKVKIISGYGVGYDAVDVDGAVARDIIVTHTPDVLNADVANLTILLLLATSRCLVRDDRWARSGNWAAVGDAPLTRSIEGKKVGILGLGRIGNAIAEKLQVFNCEVVYHSRSPKEAPYPYFEDLEAMAEAVDYLVVITPGGKATEKLVNRRILDALGPEGTLINVARGTVVDEEELILALQEGRLGWAGLDVFANEPNIPEALREMENVVLTPHTASATVETRTAMGDLTVDNIFQYLDTGKAITPIPECKHMQD